MRKKTITGWLLTLLLSCMTIIPAFAEAEETTYQDETVVEDTSAAQDEAEAYPDTQYVLYLGTNDKDTNQPVFTETEAMEKAREILISIFGGYTIQEAHGGWIGDDGKEYQEYTLVIYLSDTTEEQVHKAAQEFIKVFHQSSVLIQTNPTRTEFYSGFSYVHDPRELPEAMKDIIENPEAVYGFSPDPESERLGEYAEYDWTDPDLVAQAKEDRTAYHDSMESMMDILYRMRDEGASMEEMARAVSLERNRLRLASSEDDPEVLEKVKKSNLETYGHEDGPTPDELYEKYGSWQTVLQKSFSSNLGMDACCGLYDEYYPLYIELGYVEG